MGAVIALLLVSVLLSACGAAPVAQTWPGLTVSGGSVFLITGIPQQVYILDAEAGTMKATYAPQGERRGVSYWSPVTVVDGTAFVGFSEPQAKTYGLYAFDADNGQELWHADAEDLILAAPVLGDGTIYFGSSDGRVHAIDLESRLSKPGWPFEAKEAIWGSPLVADERVYVASMDHHVYCLDAETGEEVWQREVGGAMASQPTLDPSGRTLYVGAFDGKVYAIDAASGEVLDGFDFEAGNWIWSKVLVDDDQLWVTSLDGKLYALEASTGAMIPPYPFDTTQAGNVTDRIRADPVLVDDSVVVAAESGRVMAVQNAVTQWIWPGGTPTSTVLTTPVINGDIVYVALTDGQVQTLNVGNGTQEWSFSPPESN